METPPPSQGAGTPPPSLVTGQRRVLRPLIRLLLASGVTYPFLANLLKSVYVEVAERDFRIQGKRQSDSRINLLTGVHRKDVKRLRGEGYGDYTAPGTVSLGAQLVARWTGVAEYQDQRGRPLPLARLASDGGDLSFERLVESVNKDIRSRVVLDEWVRLGVARVDNEDRVCLNVDAFVPEKGYDEKAYYFGRNVGDHLAAAAHNLGGGQPPFLERSVYYDGLSTESVRDLAALAERLGMEALQAVNRRAIELQSRDAASGDATRRINFGVYYFSAPDGRPNDKER